jgi:hypothetical protein
VRPATWFPPLILVALVVGGCGAGTAKDGAVPSTTPGTSTTVRSTTTAPVGSPLHFSGPTTVATGAGLAAVSCGSADSCLAFDTAGRAYLFDGTHWSGPTPPAPQPIGPGAISVSCSAPTSCSAIATAGNTVTGWNGQVWSAPTALDGADGLEAVGCAPSGYCAAVDAEGNAFALDDGTWSGTSGDWGSVSDISCVSSSFCMSVSGGISQWNGEEWAQPDPFGDASSFAGVSCPTVAFCTAVDDAGGALQWNGSAWSAPTRIEPGPASATTLGISTTGVSCPTASYCAATDASGGILQWSNNTWSRADVDRGRHLTSISCPTASLCVAVDRSGDAVVGRD